MEAYTINLQLAVEPRDHFSDPGRELAQEGGYFLIVEPKGGLPQRYERGEKCIALRRVEDFAAGQTEQDGLIFQAFDRLGSTDVHMSPHHQKTLNVGARGQQPLVLAEDIQSVKGPKGVIPSLVRVERFDRGSFALGKPLFAFDALQWVDHGVEGIKDWKVRTVARFYAIACCQGSGEKIKTATERIDDGPDLGIERERKRLIVGYRNILSSIRITLLDNGIGVTTLPFDEALLQQWDLGYGPIDGSLSVWEIVAHGLTCPRSSGSSVACGNFQCDHRAAGEANRRENCGFRP